MKSLIYNLIDHKGEEEEECETEKMSRMCDDIIEKYKNEPNKNIIGLDIDKIKDDDIEITEIYSDIIKSLIINNKLDESEETINLLKEIEIKSVRLNKNLFESLSKVLIEKYLNRYEILNYNDLFNNEKITFYFILFEYILKSSVYIFHIPFLIKTRNNIKEIIKNNLGNFSLDLKNGENKIKNNKLKIVLEYFIEFKYYYQKGLSMERSKDIKKKIDSKHLKKKEDIPNSINIKDIKIKEEDTNSESDSLNRNIDYNSINDNYPNVLDFMRNNYFYNQNHIYDFLTRDQLICLNKEKAFFILSDSIFTLSVEYKKEKNETFIKYKNIICKNAFNEEEEFKIEEVKSLTSKNNELNYYYQKFLEYLNKFDKELRNSYKTEKEIEIELKFKMSNYNEYIVNCELLINNEEFEENCFKDENILKFSDHQGLYLMIEALNDC